MGNCQIRFELVHINSNDFSYAWKLGITLYISKQSKNPFEMNISQIIALMK